MNILIELPNWLGDTVMATPAIENLANFYKDPKITLIGSLISIETVKNHPKVVKTYVLDKKLFNIYKSLIILEEFDVFFSFRSSFRAKIIKFFVSSQKKFQFDNSKYNIGHQVEKYNNFINASLNINSSAGGLIIHNDENVIKGKNKILGINPGASYGSSKRWYPEKFAEVAVALSSKYDIIIFGGPDEKDMAADIESHLIKKRVNNFKNLAAKTKIRDLITQISRLDLFLTGDTGPMHIAAAFKIPTVAIFGPTKDAETSQWMNQKSTILKKSLACQPCMKRSCPLGHHNCMKLIEAKDVLNLIKTIN
jgi:heptosyltransferase II